MWADRLWAVGNAATSDHPLGRRMTADRTYWHVSGARSWHADRQSDFTRTRIVWSLCGLSYIARADTETADRIPPTAHLCGNCSRVIAARTDIEP